jgi:hypothetical protein
MSKERPKPPPPPPAPAKLFQRRIEAALAEGRGVADMTLHLTLGDVRRLKRDADVPLDAIRYEGGVMRFLGVKVVEGGVDASTLASTLEGPPEA